MNWVGVIGYTLSIGGVLLLVGGMLFVVRLMSDDSERFKDLKEMVETLMGTPAHLRPSPPEENDAARQAAAASEASPAGRAATPFEDACPACREPVDQTHVFCPLCELRLQD